MKELDLITQKRADLAGAPVKSVAPIPIPAPVPKPKPKTKKGAWEEPKVAGRRRRRRVEENYGVAHVPGCTYEPDFNDGLQTPKIKRKLHVAPAPSLSESISFPVLLASLPRWILKAPRQVLSHLSLWLFASARTFQR